MVEAARDVRPPAAADAGDAPAASRAVATPRVCMLCFAPRTAAILLRGRGVGAGCSFSSSCELRPLSLAGGLDKAACRGAGSERMRPGAGWTEPSIRKEPADPPTAPKLGPRAGGTPPSPEAEF